MGTFEDRYDSVWSGTSYDDTEDFEESTTEDEDGLVYSDDKDEQDYSVTNDTSQPDDYGTATGGLVDNDGSEINESDISDYVDTQMEEHEAAQEEAEIRDEERGLHDNYRSPITWLQRDVAGKAVVAVGIGLTAAFALGGR